MALVDVAINHYGKPFHTMVAIGSLLEHSRTHIGKVYLIVEREQPEGGEAVIDLLAEQDWPVEVFVPEHYFGVVWHGDRQRLFDDTAFRQSVRYQYALETTCMPYLFTTHNDMLFLADVISPLVETIESGGYAGVGDIGQCWNCPAKVSGVCTPETLDQLSLTHDEAVRLYREYPSGRPWMVDEIDATRPLPLPECRLNEWFALLDVAAYSKECIPRGDTEPFGSYALLDVGCAWFASMWRKGYRFAHQLGPSHHSWASGDRVGGGHPALSDRVIYDREEAVAEQYYKEHYTR